MRSCIYIIIAVPATQTSRFCFRTMTTDARCDGEAVVCPKFLQLVLFGRPGAGKTTIANKIKENAALEKAARKIVLKTLDLDVCIPPWMKDNFQRGVYPTLEERKKFALECCDFVDSEVATQKRERTYQSFQRNAIMLFIVSFSFVNRDLRDIYRARFPDAVWILVDTPEDTAAVRIKQREDHFYKIADAAEVEPKDNLHVDNSEWNFAPVTFPHIALDGNDKPENNAERVLDAVALEIER